MDRGFPFVVDALDCSPSNNQTIFFKLWISTIYGLQLQVRILPWLHHIGNINKMILWHLLERPQSTRF
jgi:hypothetical protein